MYKAILLLAATLTVALAVVNPSLNYLYNNDNDVLRFALFLENFDTNFYALHLDPTVSSNVFTAQDFINAGYSNQTYNLFLVFLSNERAHIALLNQALFARNGTMIPPCQYNYPVANSVNDFIFYSKVFENVGTAAYDGSINSIYNKTLQTNAATIATVEARHAAFLNLLNTTMPAGATIPNMVNITSPFPYVLDLALASGTVFSIIMPFVASCPYTIPINPTVNVIIPVTLANQPANPSLAQVTANDIATLNFALTLERLEAYFYNYYLSQSAYNVAAFQAAGFTPYQRAYFDVIRAHENMHVMILSNAIINLGGTPVGNCTYNFPVTNVSTFISTSSMLENTGVSAYDGAVNTINDPTLRQNAAQIATVEGRHAAFVNELAGLQPFSTPTDTPLQPATVVSAVTSNQPTNGLPFISSCPFDITALPSVLTIIPYSNTSSATPTNPATATTAPTGASPTAAPTRGPTSSAPTSSAPTSAPSTGRTSSSNYVAASVSALVISSIAMLAL